MDALASVDGSDPLQVTKSAWPGIGKALADIRSVSPTLTPDEISRRATNYALHFRDAPISAHALAKHWARCDRPPAPRAHANGTLFHDPYREVGGSHPPDAESKARRQAF